MLTKEQLFLTGLRALRNTLDAAVDQIDIVLHAANQAADVSRADTGECPHPPQNRIGKAAMGHPNRFHCTACKKDIEE